MLLIFSQVFVPDPAAVGQHIADVAFQMASRGHQVRVYTSRRGYDDPTRRYPARESLRGVDVRRLPFSSFGKKNLFTRGIGTASFMIQALFLALFTPRVDAIFFSTSPPLIGVIVSLARLIRRYPIIYWAMDLNPDQLIALGKISPRGIGAHLLEMANRFILHSSALVIALDRFMAQRLLRRARVERKLVIIPPWYPESAGAAMEGAVNPFRQRHGLEGKFVVMYSGNHSSSNPLTTLLEAALRLRDEKDLLFLFVGGGIGKKDVEQFIGRHTLSNALSLPYQPLEDLRYSLPAADVQVVSLGDPMVGIVHPCKIYSAMAVARPVLYFGPIPSHVADLLDKHNIGLRVAHGDVDGALAAIRTLRGMGPSRLAEMGQMARAVLHEKLNQQLLCSRLCAELETVMHNNPRCD